MTNHKPPARMPGDLALDKHRNPNGTYDGIGVMADLTGHSRDEITAIAEQVKANHVRLNGCAYHEFEALITAPPGHGKYRCRNCGGEINAIAHHWHELGRRTKPAADPKGSRT